MPTPMQDTGAPSVSARTLLWRLLFGLICLTLTWNSTRLIQNNSVKGDATQNLYIAYNIAHYGSFSRTRPEEPTSFREPIPPLVTAIYLRLTWPISKSMTVQSLHAGDNARFVKMVNAFWLLLGLAGTWLLAMVVLNNRFWSAVALVLSYTFFFGNHYVVNSLYTELPTGSLAVWFSWMLIRAMQIPSLWRWAMCGGMLGLIAMTKVVMGYAGFMVLVLCLAYLIFERRRLGIPGWRASAQLASGAMLVFALIVMPWIARNHFLFGSNEITYGRSGYVMYKRALMDHLTDAEYKYGFYMYGPGIYREWAAHHDLAVTNLQDLQRGGPLQRMNFAVSDFIVDDTRTISEGRPELTISFYRKAAAMYSKLRKMLVDAHHPRPDYMADKIMQQVAVQNMLTEPLDHLKVSVLLFWRGFWVLPVNLNLPFTQVRLSATTVEVVNVLIGLSLFAAFLVALLRRNAKVLIMAAPMVFMMGIYALISQNLNRFNGPAVPLMCISLVWMISASWRTQPVKG